MSKKMLKRSLALGALMAFVITGSAMSIAEATHYEQAKGAPSEYADINKNVSDVKQRALGGWDNPDRAVDQNNEKDENATKVLNSKITVTGGNWNAVVGGHWTRDFKTAEELQLNVASTNTLIKDATVRTVIGGSASVNYQTLNYNGNGVYNLEIVSGTFGHKGYEVKANVPELFVAGGDLLKYSTYSSVISKNDVVSIKSSIKETNTVINGGTFDSAIIGGSVAMTYYDPSNKDCTVEAKVDNANVVINGGEFNHAIVAGGFAWGKDAVSEVKNASLIISGKATINENVYAGGLRNDNNALGTAKVESAVVAIDNVQVKDVYGTGAIIKNVATGDDGYWSYVQDTDTKAIVNTDLTLTNVTAGTVDIQKGSVTLATTGDGTTEVKTLKTGTGVAVSMVADGTATDTLNGNAEEFRKKITITDSYDGYESVKGLMKAGEVVGDVTFKLDEYGNVIKDSIQEKIHKGNASVNSMSNIALMAWRAETNDMNKRMGELRNANGEHGVWVRVVGGEDEYKSVEYDYTQYQLGYDEKLSTDPTWTVGMALTYTDGESKFAQGSGENEHKGVAIYGSKLNADGSFVDLIAKYSRLEHDFTRDGAKGDYSTNGYSVSAEYGKRYEQSNGLWIEPQVELTYGKVKSADYKLGNVLVNQDAMESLIGRVGFSIGKDIKQGNVYARASYLYDFEGETATTFTNGGSRQFEDDLGGDWWEVGVGANINLSKATYVYADVEKTFGGEVDTNWQWNLGVRYSF